MIYTIKKHSEKVDWTSIEPITIENYPWGNQYSPETKAWLYYIENHGFYLKMRCLEANPKACYTQSNDPVYKDSCMEFFVNFYSDTNELAYMNFEMNSNGAMLCQYGEPGNRHFLLDLGFDVPKPKVTRTEAFWEVELMIPNELIRAVYKKSVNPTTVTGNFYKCGDETHTPHYGCWSPIDYPHPAFHLPQYFGDLVID